MVPVEVLASFVREQFPFAFCPVCTAAKLQTTEKDIREASQLLVLQPGFGTIRRTCYGCSRVDDTVEMRPE